ncbi:hypothetical protein EGR_06287 [Echinococcus granulosus]|uniref:Uncharacterized protein n=1 Tax=Echinococcus granulosus TaxID=6210 RepID=W6UBU4_ECHGR|nr:hypothetical protein EGR_06287 [Echinococcus granulosus]EUB58863.1 hypothetical protein EGR_06287 [Echinococcus granulosus]
MNAAKGKIKAYQDQWIPNSVVLAHDVKISNRKTLNNCQSKLTCHVYVTYGIFPFKFLEGRVFTFHRYAIEKGLLNKDKSGKIDTIESASPSVEHQFKNSYILVGLFESHLSCVSSTKNEETIQTEIPLPKCTQIKICCR